MTFSKPTVTIGERLDVRLGDKEESRVSYSTVSSCNPQMVQKEDDREQEEVHGTISNEEWNKMVEETLRKDKKLLEKLAKI